MAKGAARISAAEAAALVRPGMWLDYGISFSQADVFDAALAERVGELSDVNFRNCFTLTPRHTLEADPEGQVFHYYNWHFSGYDRANHDRGLVQYIPLNLGETPDYYRRFLDPPDIVVLKTRPMDMDGWFNFGPTSVWNRAIVERARCVIVEITEGFPWVAPTENGIHISEVDYVIQGDNAPAPTTKPPVASDIDRAVAQRIAGEIEDGACLQIGIGGMPDAVCGLIRESGARDLGLHTELLTQGAIDLYTAGIATGAKKQIDTGKVVFTFAVGPQSLYDTIGNNPDAWCKTVDYTNNPAVVMQNEKVVSINSTTQIDLQGQCASESDGHRHISGTGGQLQFVRGAYASKGGKSFICTSSTYERKGVRKSRIVLDLTPGNVVTTPRSDAMYIVTEYGMVNLKGKSVPERARALIDLAHPDFREELERQAWEAKVFPRHFARR
jgi:acyl-CoA hydrolase